MILFRSSFHHSYTSQPIKDVLFKADTYGRITKWSTELAEFGIEYALKTAVKSHILANFIVGYSFRKQLTLQVSFYTYFVGHSNYSTTGGSELG